mmetsp:Transcript_58079/g.136416  ORF Transcript_58079/g.136416 Transcript_58079/m.136416 type:complete len:412 (+) Transcript_58079:80-1315(+)
MKCGKCGGKDLEFNFLAGKIFCSFCGFLIEENISNPEISFDKNGSFKKSIRGQMVQSSEKNLYSEKAPSGPLIQAGIQRRLSQMGSLLKLTTWHIEAAFRLFIFANQQGFFQNRKMDILCISCLYTICRQNKTPHLLVDFSDITQIRANKIGVDFLRFRKLMNLSLPIIDPSLFVHRFATRLHLGNKTNSVVLTSLRLIARMKRDWISTGRRPAGLCGAALLLASHIHGIKKSKKEISEVVRIGNIILSSRLKEIKKTSIGFLTTQEIDFGGGDDGDKDSLGDVNSIYKVQPPSRSISLEKFSPSNLSRSGNQKKNNLRLKKRKTPLKKKENETNSILIKKKNFLEKKINYGKGKLSEKESSSYINSKFETFVKESIWFQSNINYFLSQSVNARAQKERPFAFFGTNSLNQ